MFGDNGHYDFWGLLIVIIIAYLVYLSGTKKVTDSAKSFWAMIVTTIIAGIVYMKGCRKLFKWWDKREK